MPTWKEITEFVGKDVLTIIKEEHPEKILTGYQRLIPGNHIKSDAFIQMVEYTGFDKIKFQPDISVFVHIKASDHLEKLQCFHGNLAVYSGEASVRVLFERMNDLFAVHYTVDALLADLQRMVSSDAGIKTMITRISDFLKLPVDILDNSFRFLVVSDDRWLGSKLRREHAHVEGQIPAHIIEELKSSGQVKTLIETKEMLRVSTEEYAAWLYPLVYNRVKIGYMAIFDRMDNKILDRVLDEYKFYMPFIADFLCLELGKQTIFNVSRGGYYNYMLSSVLNGRERDLEDIRQKLRAANYMLEKNMYLISVETKEAGKSSRWMQTVSNYLADLFNHSIYVSRSGRLYYLVSRTDRFKPNEKECEIWRDYLASTRLRAGMTGPFYDFEDMTIRCQEADIALDTAKSEAKDFVWFQCSQIDALKTLLSSRHLSDSFCMENVKRLIDYDSQHGTELVDTLKSYLARPKDVAEICNMLHIHRNTFYKRIDRIKELLECDLTKPDDIMQILLTLYLLGYN